MFRYKKGTKCRVAFLQQAIELLMREVWLAKARGLGRTWGSGGKRGVFRNVESSAGKEKLFWG